MRNHRKPAIAVISAALIAAQALSSFAFYQTPESKKGLLISQQEMFSDVQALGVKQVICNLSSAQQVDAFQTLARNCKRNNITLTMILINSPNARDKSLLPVSSLVDGVSCYAFNTLTSEGEQAVRSYARSVASYYADTVSNWVIGNEVNDGHSWDYNGITDIDQHAASYAKAFRIFYDEIKKANPYVDGFYLSRQVDAQSQVSAGGAFGLWTRNESAARDEMPQSKKKAWYTYQALN